MLRNLEKKICRRCKQPEKLYQSGFCKECYVLIDAERQEKKKTARHKDDKGYVRVYDDEGKLVLEHRYVMEKHLGRKLEKEETVVHRDGNRSNNDPSNLVLSIKGGTPLERIVCTECGCKGKFVLDSQINDSQQVPEQPVGLLADSEIQIESH